MHAVILGTQSFIDGGAKVSTQYFAQALAEAGWNVDYIPTLSSVFDIVGSQRHSRLIRAWGSASPKEIAPRLFEWTIKSPFPAHRWFMRYAWQTKYYGCFLPISIREKEYDVCITDVTPNMMLTKYIRSNLKICRLNDWPPGFLSDLHENTIKYQESLIKNCFFDEIWAVSHKLHDYALYLNEDNSVIFMPNGVENEFFKKINSSEIAVAKKNIRSAVYVGGMTAWLDKKLLLEVAHRMPDWSFDIYGGDQNSLFESPKNLRWLGSISRDNLIKILPTYEVGLIPFCDVLGRMDYVERPLKFYEYIAAGLGVASTDIGSLKSGMGELACYGNGVNDFALAIENAQKQALRRNSDSINKFLYENSWEVRTKLMLKRLEYLIK